MISTDQKTDNTPFSEMVDKLLINFAIIKLQEREQWASSGTMIDHGCVFASNFTKRLL